MEQIKIKVKINLWVILKYFFVVIHGLFGIFLFGRLYFIDSSKFSSSLQDSTLGTYIGLIIVIYTFLVTRLWRVEDKRELILLGVMDCIFIAWIFLK